MQERVRRRSLRRFGGGWLVGGDTPPSRCLRLLGVENRNDVYMVIGTGGQALEASCIKLGRVMAADGGWINGYMNREVYC